MHRNQRHRRVTAHTGLSPNEIHRITKKGFLQIRWQSVPNIQSDFLLDTRIKSPWICGSAASLSVQFLSPPPASPVLNASIFFGRSSYFYMWSRRVLLKWHLAAKLCGMKLNWIKTGPRGCVNVCMCRSRAGLSHTFSSHANTQKL